MSRSGSPGGRSEALRRSAFRGLRIMPARFTNALVRWSSPTYSVASIVLIRDDAGRYLMVRPTYRDWWGFPGGMIDRHEEPGACAVREAREEVGADIELVGPPVVVVDVHWHRLEFAYRGRLLSSAEDLRPGGAEIAEVAWRHPAELSELAPHGQWLVDQAEAAWGEGRTLVLSPRIAGTERGLRHR